MLSCDSYAGSGDAKINPNPSLGEMSQTFVLKTSLVQESRFNEDKNSDLRVSNRQDSSIQNSVTSDKIKVSTKRDKRQRRSSNANQPILKSDGSGLVSHLIPAMPISSQASQKSTVTMESNKLAAPMNREVGSSKSYSGLKTLETFIETMGIDVPSNRKLLAYNRVRKVWQQLICFFIKDTGYTIIKS